MSQKGTKKIILRISLLAVFFSFGICCKNEEWKCNNGKCISWYTVCDGEINCSDESDEIAATCIQEDCPSFAFRCAYGACVIGTAKCNGVKECADNSDEISALCRPDDIANNTYCNPEHFECSSGVDCISYGQICDGIVNCPDESDEIVDLCGANTCPPFSFRCGYGACISIDKQCDGNEDCRDGSDEALNICSYETPTESDTSIGCKVPLISNGRIRDETNPEKIINPGDIVAEGTSFIYQCNSGYIYKGTPFNRCLNSKWDSSMHGECIEEPKPAIESRSGCIAPLISNGQIQDETNPEKFINPGDIVAEGTSFIYQCNSGYICKGTPFNRCLNSKWDSSMHGECIETDPPAGRSGCLAPDIKNGRLVYKSDDQKVINAGETVPDGTSITYQCDSDYTRTGPQHNKCTGTKWEPTNAVVCENLTGETQE